MTGSHKLSKGSLLDLKMKVSSAEETSESYRQIVFSSTCFESSVTGIWKTDKCKIKIIDISDPRVSPDKIFLEFD
ncbi:hypothetical protein [Mycoplasma ovis]|uniref:hypothetical protein n=1 Tax=Mycoplasma ovis TaxID=171632 RepID=UPI00040A6697|nr:hypothetical protein [Mycoplasma ovis]